MGCAQAHPILSISTKRIVMKLRNRWVIGAVFAVAIAGTACGSTGGPRLYQKEVGLATRLDLERVATLNILRFHYEVAEHDSIPFLRWETHWRPRRPFADEQELGITNAETRLVITGRSRSESESSTYATRVIVENRVRVAGDVDWNPNVNTPLFIAYADSISEEFRKEFANIGIRRH
jgi:hypothetical protein